MNAPILSVGRRVRFRHVLDAFRRHAGRPRSVLDAGCGDGRLAAALARLHGDARVVGVDADPRVLELRRDEESSLPNLELRVGEVGGAALPERFDAAVCTDVLEHVPDDERAFTWLADHLTPGGVLVLHVPASGQRHVLRSVADAMAAEVAGGRGPHVREGYTRERLRSLLTGAGFDVLELGATFHAAPTRAAADVDTWTFLRGARPVKAVLLPALLAAASVERRPAPDGAGNGLLAVARRR